MHTQRPVLLTVTPPTSRAHEKQAPQVVGIATSELESSAAQYNKQARVAS